MTHTSLLALVLDVGDDGKRSIFQSMWVPFIVCIGIAYFFIIMPEKKRRRKHQEMQANLKKNDRVMFGNGLLGVVTNVRETEVTIRVDDARDVKIRVSRNSISGVLNPSSENDEQK